MYCYCSGSTYAQIIWIRLRLWVRRRNDRLAISNVDRSPTCTQHINFGFNGTHTKRKRSENYYTTTRERGTIDPLSRRWLTYHTHLVGVRTEAEVEAPDGFLTRCCPNIFRSVDRAWKMYPIGCLFGLGFDTASEVGLLALPRQHRPTRSMDHTYVVSLTLIRIKTKPTLEHRY